MYIATGRFFIDEAIDSYRSLRKFMPSLPVCIFTDDTEYAGKFFETVIKIEKPFRNFLEKIPPLEASPYERTLFVDTDTIFAGDMSDVFDLLDRFDIAAAPDPFWVVAPTCPPCFQHLNTGLIVYRKNDQVNAFFRQWFLEFETELKRAPDNPENWHDQVHFQRLLYHSPLRLYVLPVEYNIRVQFPQILRVWAPAKLMHSHEMSPLPALGKRLNNALDYRIVFPNWTLVHRTTLHMVGGWNEKALNCAKWIMDMFVGCGIRVLREARRLRSAKETAKQKH
jgi:hypothetical protein